MRYIPFRRRGFIRCPGSTTHISDPDVWGRGWRLMTPFGWVKGATSAESRFSETLRLFLQIGHPARRPARRAGSPHCRIRSHPAGRDCHLLLWTSDGANPTQPACSAGPAVRPCGSSSDAGSCRVANKVIRIVMATPSKTGDTPQDTNNAKPRRQNHGVVEKPQGWRASLALHCFRRSSMIQ